MEGRVIPYLKEVRLAGNLSSQLQGTYIRTLLRIYMRPCYTQVDATCRVHPGYELV